MGGKNGVNFRGYKNMIGVFNQPEFVIWILPCLTPLDDREYQVRICRNLKAAAIKSETLFDYLEEHYQEALDKNPDVLEKIIYDSVMIKAAVVEAG